MSKELVKMKMSNDGRVQIPKNIRNSLHLFPGIKFDVVLDRDDIILKPVQNRCKICGKTIDLTKYICEDVKGMSEVYLCNKCVSKIIEQ